jgi:hypothetical protein
MFIYVLRCKYSAHLPKQETFSPFFAFRTLKTRTTQQRPAAQRSGGALALE